MGDPTIPQLASVINALDEGTASHQFKYDAANTTIDLIRDTEESSLWAVYPVDLVKVMPDYIEGGNVVRKDTTVLLSFADGGQAGPIHRGLVLSSDGFVLSTFTR